MASPYALVRVEDPTTGHQFTTTSTHAESAGLKVLSDKDATDQSGRPVPALHRTDKAGQPAPRKTDKKEND